MGLSSLDVVMLCGLLLVVLAFIRALAGEGRFRVCLLLADALWVYLAVLRQENNSFLLI